MFLDNRVYIILGNFAENFEDRLKSLIDTCRNLEPVIYFLHHNMTQNCKDN